ncbi:citryl-CoA lyase [Mycobacteroides stephanolepidis]|uniref:Citryl-CoA lyase n=1 Tax=[Mycobacterium] stephanolepidis TaxID=1520670 RepID=A0A1Z4EYE7_9MYCO|nr:CoA ester lyase [[Mycobacterium] stephanolepidis]BAX97952.1 citryl-CoA lyase [[Mycobacterium] stephanolepidis]
MTSGTAHRSWLYVPGDRGDRFPKAAGSGADVVICDLEDAVAQADKNSARDAVAEWLRDNRAAVRVNGIDTPWHADDIAAVTDAPGLRAVIVPKSAHPDQIAEVSHSLGGHIPLVPLIESAAGVSNASAIAASSNVSTLAFGSIDFALDLGIDGVEEDEQALLYARSVLVIACRQTDIGAPIDGVTVTLTDPDVVRHDAERARRLGFAGKQCIHPRQIATVNAVFTPSLEAVARARDIVEAARKAHGSAVELDGQMIDKPRIDQAHRILDTAEIRGALN